MGRKCISINIGGTSMKTGLFETDGTLVDKWEVRTRKEERGKYTLEGVTASIKGRLVDKGIEPSEMAGAGISVPGPIMSDGYVEVCVNLDWGDKSLVRGPCALLGAPVRAGNDTNAVALGEMWQSDDKGYMDIVVMTSGVDVGSGVIINEKVIARKYDFGDEVNHIHIRDEETEHCSCGGAGCVKQIVLAMGIAREARRKMAASGKPSALRESGEYVTAKNVPDTVKAGDKLAVGVMEVVGHYLGLVLSQPASTMDPEIFVIGGGTFKAEQFLIDMTGRHYDKCMVISKNRPIIGLVTLGNDTGTYGAARLISG